MSYLLAIIRLGLNNLRLHKLRSFLTSLGIILGVSAVIIMVAIGEGNKQAALRDIQQLGATNIILRSTKPAEASDFGSQERSMVIKFGMTRTDLRRIGEAFTDAFAVVPLKEIGSEISFREKRDVSQAFGVTPQLLEVTSLKVAPGGRYITAEDMASRAPVAVIGHEVSNRLFRLVDPVGATIRIDDQVFKIVGVLKPVGLAGGTGSALVGRDLNLDVHIPFSTAESSFGDILFKRQAGSFSGEEVEISEVFITAPNTDTVVNMASRVKRLMEVGHPGLADVTVIVPWELLENVKKTTRQMNMLLTAIAAISLLVGGIGIMNIMLASVTERTREIGIRRALGATRLDIVAQFLVETGSLSTVGGVAGILFGVGVAIFVDRLLPRILELRAFQGFFESSVRFEAQVTSWSVLISFLVAASVGLIFGIYPAIVASQKDPIVALRHD